MNPSRSHRLVHVINNCGGPNKPQDNRKHIVNVVFLFVDLMFIKFLINTREI